MKQRSWSMPLSNKYYLRFYLCFLSLCFVCCSPGGDLHGVYGARDYNTFTLNKDSTFEYRYKFGFAYGYSSGIWEKINTHKILLRSYIENRALKLKILENKTPNSGVNNNLLTVSVNIPEDINEYYQCFIFVNDTLYERRYCDSLNSIKVGKTINSLYFAITVDQRIPGRYFDTLYTEKKFISNNPGNQYLYANIDYTDSLFNYKVFDNQILKIDSKKRLKFFSTHSMSWKYLRKKISSP